MGDLPADVRVVTEDDILRIIGFVAEVLGWLAVLGALLFGFVQWDQKDEYEDEH